MVDVPPLARAGPRCVLPGRGARLRREVSTRTPPGIRLAGSLPRRSTTDAAPESHKSPRLTRASTSRTLQASGVPSLRSLETGLSRATAAFAGVCSETEVTMSNRAGDRRPERPRDHLRRLARRDTPIRHRPHSRPPRTRRRPPRCTCRLHLPGPRRSAQAPAITRRTTPAGQRDRADRRRRPSSAVCTRPFCRCSSRGRWPAARPSNNRLHAT